MRARIHHFGPRRILGYRVKFLATVATLFADTGVDSNGFFRKQRRRERHACGIWSAQWLTSAFSGRHSADVIRFALPRRGIAINVHPKPRTTHRANIN